MRTRPQLPALLALVLIAPVWTAFLAGLVEVRACVPTGSPILAAHLVLIRPDAQCPSGMAVGDSAFAVLGTIGLLSALAWTFGTALLAWVGAIAVRGRTLVQRLIAAVVPGARMRAAAVVPTRIRWFAVVSHRQVAPRWFTTRISRRGPPLFA